MTRIQTRSSRIVSWGEFGTVWAGGADVVPFIHRTDEEVGRESDDEKSGHQVKREVIGLSGGTPAAFFASEIRSTRVGPITAAADHAVMRRPWIAPTWWVPKRSRR